MSESSVTVAIPVGPYPGNTRWLNAAIVSARQPQVDEILLISDMAEDLSKYKHFPEITIWKAPWRLGVATAFNFGVALAKNECVFMLGSDDWLEPNCIEECLKSYHQQAESRRGSAYYAVGVHYIDGRENPDQYIACNAAMVTKTLWKLCGGFPIQAFSASDAALLSIFIVHPKAGHVIAVGGRQTLYNYRPHEETDTAKNRAWYTVLKETRNLVTKLWEPPSWT